MALMHACSRGFEGIVQLLLDAGAVATIHEKDDVCSVLYFLLEFLSVKIRILRIHLGW